MEDSNSKEKKKLTSEQRAFYMCMTRLDKLEHDMTYNVMSNSETIKIKRNIDSIQQYLWELIYKYARSLAASSMKNYRCPNDYLSELTQSMAEMFYTKLPLYRPLENTPTTFFTPYFYEVIGKYKRNESQHFTASEANNVRKVRTAMKELEAKGLSYDYQVLATCTGLSVPVVRKTVDRMNTSIIANIDDLVDLQSKELNPEEAFIENEKKIAVNSEIERLLTPFEQCVFRRKFLTDDSKASTYKAVAEYFGKPEHEIKSLINHCKVKLANSPILQSYSKKKIDTDDCNLNTMSNATDLMEASLESSLLGLD